MSVGSGEQARGCAPAALETNKQAKHASRKRKVPMTHLRTLTKALPV
jgi:hypothetical protein